MIDDDKKTEMKKFTVLRDNKEKVGAWYWEECGYCGGTLKTSLKTGDYTMLGYEDIVCVERKRTVAEFATNLSEKRFVRELERMQVFAVPYIICEFSISDVLDFPHNVDLPEKIKKKIKMNGRYILKRIHQIIDEHNVYFMFCDDKQGAWEFVNALFKRIANAKNPK
jgi:hypothetical protein